MKRFALTAVGRDRHGIVSTVTKALYEHGCNMEDSSMTILQDEFAIILIMSAPDDVGMKSLVSALEDAEKSLGLTIHFKEIGPEQSPASPPSDHLVTVSGYDKPGIVFKTADMLSKWSANITDLSTKVVHGDDGNLYIMVMEVSFPERVVDDVIEDSLKTLGDSMGVTIEVKPIESYEDL